MEHLPGYDDWKLASPYDEDKPLTEEEENESQNDSVCGRDRRKCSDVIDGVGTKPFVGLRNVKPKTM